MVKLVEVKALPGYRIWVKFADGSQGEVDLSSLVGKGVFVRFKDKGFFEKAHIDGARGTVAWDENIDLCPDTLYMQITGKSSDEIYPNLKSRAANA